MLRSLAPALSLSTLISDGTVVLRVRGPLVAGRCEALSAWALRRLPSCTRLLVVDLSGVTELDPCGVGALVALRRRTSGEVVLRAVPAGLRAQLQRAGVLALLPEAAPAEAPTEARAA